MAPVGRTSLIQSLGVIILALMALLWAEFYLPVRESLRVDVLSLVSQMRRDRAEISRRRSELPRLRSENRELAQAVAEVGQNIVSAFSEELYIAINTAANRLFLRRGRDVVRDVTISTGSRDSLQQGKRKWVFDTPRGIMTVWRKKEAPVWIKPDWAFLEAGESIPAKDSPLRPQRGVLGDYLLDLGGGIAIHGTQAEDLLGQSVTHGCIRVGRDDLKVLWDSVPVGAKVYIY